MVTEVVANSEERIQLQPPLVQPRLPRASKELHGAGAEILCVDVAHGHHAHVKRAIGVLRGKFGGDIHIIAGNVATAEAFEDISDWELTVSVSESAAVQLAVRELAQDMASVLDSIIRCMDLLPPHC